MSDFWEGAKGVLSTVAPMLATAVGGPLAGAATGAIINALGLAPDTPPEQVAAAVRGATPEQLLALKQADQAFTETMRKLEIDASKLGYDDRANARAMATASKDRTPAVLAYIVVAGVAVVCGVVLSGHAPSNSELVGTVVGYAFAELRGVMGYYFGSSAGSDEKTTLLANSVPAHVAEAGAPSNGK